MRIIAFDRFKPGVTMDRSLRLSRGDNHCVL
jgi:hypothetical protein